MRPTRLLAYLLMCSFFLPAGLQTVAALFQHNLGSAAALTIPDDFPDIPVDDVARIEGEDHEDADDLCGRCCERSMDVVILKKASTHSVDRRAVLSQPLSILYQLHKLRI